jgi:hypothetical protein
MFWLTVALVYIAVLGLLAWGIYGLGIAIKWQANKDKKKFFTTVPTSGTFVFKMLEGKVLGVIENVPHWKLDEKGRFVIDHREKEFGSIIQEFLAKELGALWLGIYATVGVFKDWQWPEFRQKLIGKEGEETIKYEITGRKENVSEFRFQFSYSVRIEEIELKGNIQANLNAVFTVFYLNPVRAVFLNKDPVDLFIAMVRSAIRAWMSNRDFDEIKQITVSANKTADQIPEFWTMLEDFNGIKMSNGEPDYSSENPRGLYGKLGIIITRVELEQVEATGETLAALEAQRLAELKGNAEIMAAQKAGEAKVAAAKKAAEVMDIERGARERWVKDTIVTPTGGPGSHVANVLVAEQFASPNSHVTVLGGNVMVSIPSAKNTP